MKNQYLLFFAFLFFVSCQTLEKETPNQFGSFEGITHEWLVDTSQTTQLTFPIAPEADFSLSSYVDTSWSISLETKPESLIGNIDKIMIHQDTIYVLDIKKSKQILAFDLTGKFLFRVGKQKDKRGYTHPVDFSIDKKAKNLVVYEDNTKRLLHYNLNGTFLKEKNTSFFLYGMASLGNSHFILNCFGRSPKNLIQPLFQLTLMDSLAKVKKKGLQYKKEAENLAYRSNRFELSNFRDEVIYSPNFQGKVYGITSSSLSLKYELDFGERSLPSNYYKMDAMDFINKFCVEENKEHVVFTGPLFETEGILIFYVSIGRQDYTAIFNKATGELKYGELKDDLPNSIEIPLIGATIDDQYIVGSGDSYYYTLDKPGYGESKSKEVVDLLEQLAPTDNPILSIYKLKK